jgi:hypothetical protein
VAGFQAKWNVGSVIGDPEYVDPDAPPDGGGVSPTVAVEFGSNTADVTLTLTSETPAVDWTVDWGDGSAVDTISGGVAVATHTYADNSSGMTYNAVITTDGGSITQPIGY